MSFDTRLDSCIIQKSIINLKPIKCICGGLFPDALFSSNDQYVP